MTVTRGTGYRIFAAETEEDAMNMLAAFFPNSGNLSLPPASKPQLALTSKLPRTGLKPQIVSRITRQGQAFGHGYRVRIQDFCKTTKDVPTLASANYIMSNLEKGGKTNHVARCVMSGILAEKGRTKVNTLVELLYPTTLTMDEHKSAMSSIRRAIGRINKLIKTKGPVIILNKDGTILASPELQNYQDFYLDRPSLFDQSSS